MTAIPTDGYTATKVEYTLDISGVGTFFATFPLGLNSTLDPPMMDAAQAAMDAFVDSFNTAQPGTPVTATPRWTGIV
jgi:hypothetical protein